MDETFQIPNQPNQPESPDMVSLETTGFNTPAITPRTEGAFNNDAYLDSLNSSYTTEAPQSLKAMLAKVEPEMIDQQERHAFTERDTAPRVEALNKTRSIVNMRNRYAKHDDSELSSQSRAA